jgi:hypothetical protein
MVVRRGLRDRDQTSQGSVQPSDHFSTASVSLTSQLSSRLRLSSEFHYVKAKNRVLSLHLPPPSSFQRQSHPSASSNASGSTSSASAYDFQRRAVRDEMDDDTRFKTAEMRLGGMLDWEKTFSVSVCAQTILQGRTLIPSGPRCVCFADLGSWCVAEPPVESEGERRAPRGRRWSTVCERDRDLHAVSSLARSASDTAATSTSYADDGLVLEYREAYMQINADTLSALQIFDERTHAYMHSGTTREGLSLYSKHRYSSALRPVSGDAYLTRRPFRSQRS